MGSEMCIRDRAIASSDGPAPFMDALAVAYVTECGWSCAEKHC